MQNFIYLSEVLSEMRKLNEQKQPVPFSISVWSFNIQNKRGGKLIHYEKAVLMQPPKQKGVKRLADPTPFKNPNHWKNRTRNIKIATGEIKKINILYIAKFNGKTVVY